MYTKLILRPIARFSLRPFSAVQYSTKGYGGTTINQCPPTNQSPNSPSQQPSEKATPQSNQQKPSAAKSHSSSSSSSAPSEFPSNNIKEVKNNHPSTGVKKRDPETDARKEGKWQGATINPTQQGDA
ncbi:hypothetical protein HK097_005231 [Rhizophlyctis rosea]|uniref:Uncharacterized protein n=1 Tax=Rhizophlyctis rosea TaxID=64517 RepID=A0AAD5SFM1_9FUNG|nr:hypothetical protein HK097_005231 [Rhizophlyctis rosea]